MKLVIVAGLIACLWTLQAQADFVNTVYTGRMTDSQVPTPLIFQTVATGISVCRLNRNVEPYTLLCEVEHSIPLPTQGSTYKEILDVAIYDGAPGELGVRLFNFTVRQANRFVQTFSFAGNQEEYTNSFMNGNWYIIIRTRDNPDGELRGQLERKDRVYSVMDSSQTVPPSSNIARGLMLSSYTFANPARQMNMFYFHTVLNPTGLTINEGTFGVNGNELHYFRGAVSPFYPTLSLNEREEQLLLRDGLYANVLSQSSSTGEIRGQLIINDYVPNADIVVRLRANNVVSTSSESESIGEALISLDCSSLTMQYVIVHNVSQPTFAFLGIGNSGEEGDILFELPRAKSPIYGTIQLNLDRYKSMQSGNLYFSIRSETYNTSDGEIRGQLEQEWAGWAYLSGTAVVPPVSSPEVGIATLKTLSRNDKKREISLDFEILHSASNAFSVELVRGNEGENTRSIHTEFKTQTGQIREQVDLTDNDFDLFIAGSLYVIVRTPEKSFGEIRGQVKPFAPCKRKDDDVLTIDPGQVGSDLSGLINSSQITYSQGGNSLFSGLSSSASLAVSDVLSVSPLYLWSGALMAFLSVFLF